MSLYQTVDYEEYSRVLDANVLLKAERDAALAQVVVLREALTEVMLWVNNWDVPFIDDDEWPDTKAKVDAALAAAIEARKTPREAG